MKNAKIKKMLKQAVLVLVIAIAKVWTVDKLQQVFDLVNDKIKKDYEKEVSKI